MRSFAFCFRVSSNSTLCTLFAWSPSAARISSAEGPCAAAGPTGICIQYTKFLLGPTPSFPRSRIPEGLRPEETPRTASAPCRRLLLRPVPQYFRSAGKRPGTGLLPSSPFPSTFDVRGEFGLPPVPSRVYGWRKAAGCGDARERGGRGAGKIDPPPKHNGRPGENSLLDRQRKKKLTM